MSEGSSISLVVAGIVGISTLYLGAKWLGNLRVGTRRSSKPILALQSTASREYGIYERECTLLQQWYADQPAQRLFALAATTKFTSFGMKKLRDIAHLQRCVWALIERHPILSLTIVRDHKSQRAHVRFLSKRQNSTNHNSEIDDGKNNTPPLNHPMGPLPFEIITRTHQAHWHEIAQLWTHRDLAEDQWLFRIAIIVSDTEHGESAQDVEFVIVMHHILTDGLSSVVLMKDFLSYISSSPTALQAVPYQPLVCMDDVLDLRPPLFRVLDALSEDVLPSFLRPKKQPFWQGENILTEFTSSSFSADSHLATITLPWSHVKGLQSLAKQEHVTLHAFISAFVLSVSATLASSASPTTADTTAKVPLKIFYPIGKAIRELCQVSLTDHTGTFIVSGDISLQVSPHFQPESIPGIAQEIAQSMSKPSLIEECIGFTGLLHFLPRDSWLPWFVAEGQKHCGGHTASAEVSNLGVVSLLPPSAETNQHAHKTPAADDDAQQCIAEVKEVFLVQGRQYRAPVVCVSCATVNQQSLTITLSCRIGFCGCSRESNVLGGGSSNNGGKNMGKRNNVKVICRCVAGGMVDAFCTRFIQQVEACLKL